MKEIKFYINNKLYKVRQGETILDVALREKIDIPHLCKHPDLSIKGNCRVCLVEIKGIGLVTSCSTQVEDGMEVFAENENIISARKINLELIFSEHIEKCNTCIYQDNCVLLKYAKEYDLKISRFEERKKHYPIWQFSDSIQFDSSKCIDCRNCVEVCEQKQTCNFYEIAERGVETTVKPKGDIKNKINNNLDLLNNDDNKFDCTYCGQCIVHCPVGAISGVPHWQEVEKLLKNRGNKILVAQIAPSTRVSIGEEFGQEPGKIMTGQLIASIKKIGFDYAFDVSLGADLTTYEEAQELIHWLESGKSKPMFTSCCPAWVKFVEFFYPEFISYLTTTNSPHICSGSIIKTYFADMFKKDPRDIIVVSIMPCVAKKHEAGLKRHLIDFGGDKVKAVDYVLTTREYAYLLHQHKIDLPNLKLENLDKPLDIYSGAGVIYGASGGVMESALRTADYFLRIKKQTGSLKSVINGKVEPVETQYAASLRNNHINFKQARGMQGIKTAQVKVTGRKLKIAVVNGLGNARKFLENFKANKIKCDYVEVMACPGGCIGGGGQPVPTNSEMRAKRASALYKIDENLPIRAAHNNKILQKIYQKYFRCNKELIEKILHSRFRNVEREGYNEVNFKF